MDLVARGRNNYFKHDLTNSDLEISELLTDYFFSAFAREPQEYIDKLMRCYNTVETCPIDPSILKALRIFRSLGPNGLHLRTINELPNCISIPLSIIFDIFLTTGILPTYWKQTSKHTCNSQKGSKTLPQSYRPVERSG